MNRAKTLGFIGILNRGRKTLIGSAALEGLAKGRFAFLAKDASENTRKEARSALRKHPLPLNEEFSKAELGNAIGYESVSFLVVTDAHAAKKLVKEQEEPYEETAVQR